MRRLPPLTAVEAFVQVARLGSVKAAAEELALSSPALSRRVQAMERFIGRPLFARRHQAMLLNSDGEMLLSRIAPVLDSLGEAIEQVTGETEMLRLRLGVLPLYASRQLIHRLPDLRARHPDLHLDIDTGGHALARLGDGLDAAIVLAREIEPPLYGRRLGRNRIIAIGNRTLLEKMGDSAQPADLAQATILLHRDMHETFVLWRQAVGLPGLEPRAIDQFDSGQLMLESAAEGLGVAFMLDFHLEGAPTRGWSSCSRKRRRANQLLVRVPQGALSRRPVRLFHDWLVGDGEP